VFCVIFCFKITNVLSDYVQIFKILKNHTSAYRLKFISFNKTLVYKVLRQLPQKSTKMEDLISDLDTGSNTLLSSFWEEEDSMRTFFFALSNDKNRFRSVLSRQATRNRSGKIRRQSLMLSSRSAFMHLFNGGQDDALITMAGFDHANLNELLQHFSPLFHQYTPHVASGCNIQSLLECNNLQGRIRTISPIIALALVLV
jgi:hypothetical protein